MNKLRILIFFLVISGCGESKNINSVSKSNFIPANGLVLVENGNIGEVKAAISDYDSIAKEEVAGTFIVELHEQKDGSVAVIFPNGIPSYDIINIIVWLDAPPNQENVYGAKSWVSTPDGTTKYFLKPEIENEWGDTLIGSSKEGKSIRIYVPEIGISEVSHSIKYETEPKIFLSSNPLRFAITLDTDVSWANPKLSINKSIDHDWKN